MSHTGDPPWRFTHQEEELPLKPHAQATATPALPRGAVSLACTETTLPVSLQLITQGAFLGL